MKAPTRIVFLGDRTEAQRHTGRGRKEMMILEHAMSFRGLKQGARTVRPYPNVVIECWSCFSIRQINIHVGGYRGAEQLKGMWEECFCSTCFAMAKVITVYDETDIDCRLYDVEVCQGAGENYSYQLIEYIRAIDAGWYVTDQLVMLGCLPANEEEFCCPQQPIDEDDMCGFAPNLLVPVIMPAILSIGEAYAMWEWKKHVS